jgi:hypothetical protein
MFVLLGTDENGNDDDDDSIAIRWIQLADVMIIAIAIHNNNNNNDDDSYIPDILLLPIMAVFEVILTSFLVLRLLFSSVL